MSEVKSDIEIARSAKMKPIAEVLAKINIPDGWEIASSENIIMLYSFDGSPLDHKLLFSRLNKGNHQIHYIFHLI